MSTILHDKISIFIICIFFNMPPLSSFMGNRI